MQKILGKTRKQVLELLGSNYTTEFGGYMWVYEIDKTWFRRKKILMIEFDENDIVIHIEKANDEE